MEQNYNDIIGTAVVAAAGFGMGTAFVPGVDIALCGGTWLTMMAAIADRSGHEENKQFWGKVLALAPIPTFGEVRHVWHLIREHL